MECKVSFAFNLAILAAQGQLKRVFLVCLFYETDGGFFCLRQIFIYFFCRINSNKIKFTSLNSVVICALSTLILHIILFHMPKSADNLLRI
jgi:hypothetical protein